MSAAFPCAQRPTRGDNLSVRIFGFEGAHEAFVLDSLTDGGIEAVDVENEEYVFFGDDGTVIEAAVRDGRVVLTPTGVQRGEELRERLRTYLSQPRVAMDRALADDPVALAPMLRERERATEWPRRWFARFMAPRKSR
jgi:hypothetical protein